MRQLRYDWSFWAREEQYDPRFRSENPQDYSWWFALAGRGFGKDAISTTPILTTNGWKKIGDVNIGDEVFAWDGSKTKVLDVYHPAPRQLVEFEFCDGSKLTTSVEHEWLTWQHKDRESFARSSYGKDSALPDDWVNWRPSGVVACEDETGPSVKTTQQIIDSFNHGDRGDLNHSIPLSRPIDGVKKSPYNIDECYYIGYWLGSGLFKYPYFISLSNQDAEEICQYFPIVEYNIDTTICKIDSNFAACIKELGLVDNECFSEEIIYWPIENRLAVLRGLMDSDGKCSEDSNVEFCNANKSIADGVSLLARSLGQNPSIYDGTANPHGNGCGSGYRVCWKPAQNINPFRLKRKADRVSPNTLQEPKNHHRMIKSWRFVEYEPTTCISIDHKDKLFLLGESLIPTHNTRLGSEWVIQQVELGKRVIAIIGPNAREVRKVQIEGDSGILACSPPWNMPHYHKSTTIQMLEWPNGAVAHLVTSENADRLRGYNFDSAWLDELAAWEQGSFQDTIDQLTFALRGVSGDGKPRVCVTTTPKPHTPFVKFYQTMKKRAEERGDVIFTSGSTFANAANLAEDQLEAMKATYFDDEGNPTQLARQELFGYVMEDMDKRLWTEDVLLDAQYKFDKFTPKTELDKIVVSIDPSGSKSGDEIGMVVFGVKREQVKVFNKDTRQYEIKRLPVGYLLEDASGSYSPSEWGEKACMLYNRWNANYIIGETNFGGDLVKENIKSFDPKVVFKKAHATRGKEVRAMPVASLYETRRIKHWVGNERNKFSILEQQMLNMSFGGYVGDGSPDRVDALVWAVNDTMLKGMASSGTTDIFMGYGSLAN